MAFFVAMPKAGVAIAVNTPQNRDASGERSDRSQYPSERRDAKGSRSDRNFSSSFDSKHPLTNSP